MNAKLFFPSPICVCWRLCPACSPSLAHPDDEYFCAGLLLAARERNVPLHLVYWTRGEGGGSPRFRRFWSSLPRDWHPRVREAKKVAALLSATSLNFIGSVDPAPDPDMRAPAEETASVLPKLARLVALRSPEVVVTHGSGGDYGHPAHQKLHQIARELAAATPSFDLVTFNARIPWRSPPGFINTHDPADFVLDGQAHSEKKRNLVRTHASQKGVLEALSGPGGTLDSLIEATRYEGYHCWTQRDSSLERLRRWGDAVL